MFFCIESKAADTEDFHSTGGEMGAQTPTE